MTDPVRQIADTARRQWLTLLARRRRWLVAALTGLAVATGLQAVTPHPPATRRVWVAARNLGGGRPLAASDLRLVALPVTAVPEHALPPDRSPAGRVLAAPVDSGEPLTDRRLLGTSLLTAVAPGDVAVAVHVADAAQLNGLVRAGDIVDVFAAPASIAGTGTTTGRLVAAHLSVLAVPGPDGTGSGVVAVAASRAQAARLTAAAAGAALTVAVSPDLRGGSGTGVMSTP